MAQGLELTQVSEAPARNRAGAAEVRAAPAWSVFWNEQRSFSRRFLAGNAALFLARSARFLELRADDVVLDLGSGFGEVAGALAPRVAEYCGVDASERALAFCPRIMTRLGPARFERVELSCDALPRARDRRGYTLVVGHSVLQYLPTQAAVDRLVDELRRVTAPDARMLLADLPGDDHVVRDAGSQLWHGLRGGYAAHVLWALVTAGLSSYARTRRRHGLLHFSESRLHQIGARFGTSVGVLAEPLTANTTRRQLFAARGSKWAFGAVDASAG